MHLNKIHYFILSLLQIIIVKLNRNLPQNKIFFMDFRCQKINKEKSFYVRT